MQDLGLGPLDVEAVELLEQALLARARSRRSGPAFLASVAVRFFALVTSSWASFAFRPCAAASARIEAAASFLIFRDRSWLSPPGPIAIGVAEPMFETGYMAATSAASVM